MDPHEADGHALVDEFVQGYYGPAAEPIAQYIDLIHQPVRGNPDMRMGIYHSLAMPWLTADIIAEAEALLRDAAQRVAGDAELESRIRHARLPIWYVLAKRGPDSRTWKTTEQRVGSLNFADIAAGIAQVHEERGLTSLAEGHTAGNWLDWLADYERQLDGADPPRPADAADDSLRIIQAGHFDPHFSRGDWLVRADGASDGWAKRAPTHHWFVRHELADGEDFDPQQTYRVMARVRGQNVADNATGTLANVGLHGGGASHQHPLDADTLRDDQWHTVQVARLQPRPGAGLWIALTADASSNELIEAILIDAFWLEPTRD